MVDANQRYTVDQALKHRWIGTDDSELASRNLEANKEQLKRYLARRRFRKAILAQVAVGRFKRGIMDHSVPRNYTDAESTDAAEEIRGLEETL